MLLPPTEPVRRELEQPGQMPAGVVRVLHPQVRQRKAIDKGGEIVLDDLDRPSVDDDVMEGQ